MIKQKGEEALRAITVVGRPGDERTAVRRAFLDAEMNRESVPETPESIAEVEAFFRAKRRGPILVLGAVAPNAVDTTAMLREYHSRDLDALERDELLSTPGATIATNKRTERVVGRNGYSFPRVKQGRR